MPDATEVSKETSSTTGKESSQAVTLPEHLVGEVDEATYAKLPAEARTALSESVKSLKGNYTKKSQEVAELRRVKEALEADPDKATFLKKAMAEYDAQKAGLSVSSKEAVKSANRLEALLEDMDPAQRKVVKEFAEAIKEEQASVTKAQEKELKELKELVGSLSTTQKLSRSEALERDIQSLPGALKTLAVKHKDDIVRLGTSSGTRVSVQKLLQIVSDEHDYRKALLATPESGKDEVERARQTATSKPNGSVSTTETLVGKEDLVKSRSRNFGDQVNIGSVVSKMIKDIKAGR